MSKFKIHIATGDYCFLEADFETIDEALAEHDRIISMIKDKDGLPVREWTKIRRIMLTSGEFDPNISEQLSKAQRYWINEVKKTLRDIEKE